MKHLTSAIETLEPRIAPAAVVIFTDVDGDKVTIKTTKGTTAQLEAVLKFTNAGAGKQLDLVDFALNPVAFNGTGLTITSEKVGAGDGFVNVGHINALKNTSAGWVSLGKVAVDGDVHEIDAGPFTGKAPAMVSLTAVSMGKGGFVAANGNGDGVSKFLGNVGSLTLTGDFGGVALQAADIGKLSIAGALQGGATATTGNISVTGKIGTATVGAIEGGAGNSSGVLSALKGFGSLTVEGSVTGGGGTSSGVVRAGAFSSFSGFISATTASVGSLSVGGDVQGAGGVRSGRIEVTGAVGKLTVSGSVIGSAAALAGGITVLNFTSTFGSFSGIGSGKAVGTLTVGADVQGGTGAYSEVVFDGLSSSTQSQAQVFVVGNVGTLAVTGGLIAGSGAGGGAVVVSQELGKATVGSMSSGQILGTTLKSVRVVNDVVGTVSAPAIISGAKGLGSVLVEGSVTSAKILAGAFTGSFFPSTSFAPTPDVQIGTVTVKGDWTSSSIVAGVSDALANGFGNDDDIIVSATDNPLVVAAIKSIIIEGHVIGTAAAGDHFGFVAQQISAIRINGAQVDLESGPANDITQIGLDGTNDVSAREVAF